MIVAPSLLAVWERSGGDVGEVCRVAKELEAAGADWLHVDVMDGEFVPAQAFGVEALRALRGSVGIPLDVHLMVVHPERVVEDYVKYGRMRGGEMGEGVRVVVHPTAASEGEIGACLGFLQAEGVVGGLALDVEEDVDWIERFGDSVAQVLVMTVKAGAGGQALRPELLEKVKKIKEKWPRKVVVADGGIKDKTVGYAHTAGADGVVAGSYVVGAENYAEAIALLRRGG